MCQLHTPSLAGMAAGMAARSTPGRATYRPQRMTASMATVTATRVAMVWYMTRGRSRGHVAVLRRAWV